MKYLFFFFAIELIGFGAGWHFAHKKYTPVVPIDFPEEMPGIGATPQHPDTCIAYWDSELQKDHIEYMESYIARLKAAKADTFSFMVSPALSHINLPYQKK